MVAGHKMWEKFAGIEEELQRSLQSLETASRQVKGLRCVMETVEASGGVLSRQQEGSQRLPTVPPDTLQEPGAILSYRQMRAARRHASASKTGAVASRSEAADAGTQIRLHSRWMDMATQSVAVEGPSTNTRQKAYARLSMIGGRHSKLPNSEVIKPFHPYGAFRICWDISSMVLIVGDSITLPPALAWNVKMGISEGFGSFLWFSFWISLAFWTADLFVNMNTATYHKGVLKTGYSAILASYMRGWLFFDVLLLTLDVGYGLSETSLTEELRLFRVSRILRLFRLLRILKLTRINAIIEESAANSGHQSVTVITGITSTAIGMAFCAHLLTCMWYAIGRSMEETEEVQSWTQLADADSIPEWVQYLHAMRWIINAPAPPLLDAGSGLERGADILVSIFTLAAMGMGISKISDTLAELRAMNEARDRRRREVRQYLSHQHVPFELVSRIMRFVEYRLEKFSSTSLDTSLISPTLQLELYVSQRSIHVLELPIFKLLQECYSDVFGSLCAALEKHVYEKGEHIFIAGSWVSCLHITATGTYSYIEGFDAEGDAAEFTGTKWFGELSLYADGTLHQSTLSAQTFCETFSLRGPDLARCVSQSRGCTTMFCDYAKEFVSAMQTSKTKCGDEEQVTCAATCCRKNQHYQELFPDPKTQLKNITIPLKRGDAAATSSKSFSILRFIRKPGRLATGTAQDQELRNSDGSESNVEHFQVHPDASITSLWPRLDVSAENINPGLDLYLKGLGVRAMETYKLAQELQLVIPELHFEHSPHVVFEQPAERERAESSCISVLALFKNRYDIFTHPQAPHQRLDETQWSELQTLMSWIDPDVEQMQAAMVLLAIRALGKSKAVLQQMPREMRRPEKAILQLMASEKNVVPSVWWISERGAKCIENALEIHELFNLAQMLQGENLPANIVQLRKCIEGKSEEQFRFYILFLLGFMSGIAAGTGSRFMNGKNASAVISGIRLLKRLMECSPAAIYWGYLDERARKLNMNFSSAEDLVLVRLSCLARVQDEKDYLQLRTSWDALKARERMALIDHFLADGIQEQAFMLEFLPNCVANAKANHTVGFAGLLGVLVDLLNNLHSSIDSMPNMDKVIPVDLSEMAEFIAVVQNRFVFLTCVSRCQLQFVGQRVLLKMTGGNWGRIADPDSDMTSLAYTLQDILQKQEFLEAYIVRRDEQSSQSEMQTSMQAVDRDTERMYGLYSADGHTVRREVF